MNRPILNFRKTVSIAALAILSIVPGISRAESPFGDATHLWHMSDSSNAAGEIGSLTAQGPVEFGISQEDSDKAASLARGGDGQVARLQGGHLTLTNDAELNINPQQWSIAVRACDPIGGWQGTILGDTGNDRQVSISLRGVDARHKPMTDRNLRGGELSTAYAWLINPNGPRSVTGNTALLELVWGAQQADEARLNRLRDMQNEKNWPNPLQQDVVNAVMKPFFPVGLIDHVIHLTLTLDVARNRSRDHAAGYRFGGLCVARGYYCGR
ncbi:MAG: hypothetical protein H8E44_08225 [Planctomycetes bacterium]|nr:hypothetical protein [Planctomycetota bacterium]